MWPAAPVWVAKVAELASVELALELLVLLAVLVDVTRDEEAEPEPEDLTLVPLAKPHPLDAAAPKPFTGRDAVLVALELPVLLLLVAVIKVVSELEPELESEVGSVYASLMGAVVVVEAETVED